MVLFVIYHFNSPWRHPKLELNEERKNKNMHIPRRPISEQWHPIKQDEHMRENTETRISEWFQPLEEHYSIRTQNGWPVGVDPNVFLC